MKHIVKNVNKDQNNGQRQKAISPSTWGIEQIIEHPYSIDKALKFSKRSETIWRSGGACLLPP